MHQRKRTEECGEDHLKRRRSETSWFHGTAESVEREEKVLRYTIRLSFYMTGLSKKLCCSWKWYRIQDHWGSNYKNDIVLVVEKKVSGCLSTKQRKESVATKQNLYFS